MDALVLILQSAFFAFIAGWLFAQGNRVFAVGVLATGIGGGMAQNPFPTAGGDAYGIVGMVLFLGGLLIVIGLLAISVGKQYTSRRVKT